MGGRGSASRAVGNAAPAVAPAGGARRNLIGARPRATAPATTAGGTGGRSVLSRLTGGVSAARGSSVLPPNNAQRMKRRRNLRSRQRRG